MQYLTEQKSISQGDLVPVVSYGSVLEIVLDRVMQINFYSAALLSSLEVEH